VKSGEVTRTDDFLDFVRDVVQRHDPELMGTLELYVDELADAHQRAWSAMEPDEPIFVHQALTIAHCMWKLDRVRCAEVAREAVEERRQHPVRAVIMMLVCLRSLDAPTSADIEAWFREIRELHPAQEGGFDLISFGSPVHVESLRVDTLRRKLGECTSEAERLGLLVENAFSGFDWVDDEVQKASTATGIRQPISRNFDEVRPCRSECYAARVALLEAAVSTPELVRSALEEYSFACFHREKQRDGSLLEVDLSQFRRSKYLALLQRFGFPEAALPKS
jgi:hypothetical protein